MYCNTCNKVFASSFGLQSHQATHPELQGEANDSSKLWGKATQGVPVPYRCRVCSYDFPTLSLLEDHRENCRICPIDRVNVPYTDVNTLDRNDEPNDNNIGDGKVISQTEGDTRSKTQNKSTDTSLREVAPNRSRGLQKLKQNHVTHKCEECGRVYRWARQLELHIQGRSDDKIYHCSNCMKSFKGRPCLLYHYETQHSKRNATATNEATCEQLSQKSDKESHGADLNCNDKGTNTNYIDISKTTYDVTNQSNTSEKVVVSDITGATNGASKKFNFKYGTRSALKTRIKGTCTIYKCNECDKAFKRAVLLNLHVRGRSDDKIYHCKDCMKSFKGRPCLLYHCKTHRKRNVTATNEVTCEQLKQKSDKESQNNTHSADLSCNDKGTSKNIDSSKATHDDVGNQSTTHSGDITGATNGASQEFPDVKCGACNRVFRTRSALKKHIKGTRVIYKCNECGKVFKRVNPLKRHIQSQSMNNKYECRKCNKYFKGRSCLLYHCKVTHLPVAQKTGEKDNIGF